MLIHYLKRNWHDLIIKTVVVGLLFKIIYDFLTTGNTSSYDVIILALVTLFLIVAGWIREYFQRRKVVSFVDKDFKVDRKGVVFTLGLSSHLPNSAQMKVINTLKPKFIGFISTKEIEEHRGVVEQIVANINLETNNYRKKEVDPTNFKEIKESVAHIIDWMLKNVNKDDIVVDITGGTAVMSCGAFIAAKEYGIDTQYISSDFDYTLNKVIDGTQKALIVKG